MHQRRPTSFDIAALAGVSQPTVSRALSGNPSVSQSTRDRVLAAAEQLNYKVDRNASALRRQQARTLALLFFEEETPGGALINPFYLAMLGPMVRRCAREGYDLLISFQQLSSDWHVDFEDCRKADGIILLGYGDWREWCPKLARLNAQGTHFVRWGSPGGTDGGTTVGCDNETGGYLATRHLLDAGRRRIAFVGTARDSYPEFQDRWNGYRRALSERGIAVDPDLCVDADPSEESGRSAMAELQSRNVQFDGIFATSDLAAIGAMHALQSAGAAIPDDLSIVGFDDLPAASLSSPPLTTVRQDTRLAGESLIEALLEQIETGKASNRLLPATLVLRESAPA